MGPTGPPVESVQILGSDGDNDLHDLGGICVAPPLPGNEDEVSQLRAMRAETERSESVLWQESVPLWPLEKPGETSESAWWASQGVEVGNSFSSTDACGMPDRNLSF